jgi:hypothetical protein
VTEQVADIEDRLDVLAWLIVNLPANERETGFGPRLDSGGQARPAQ